MRDWRAGRVLPVNRPDSPEHLARIRRDEVLRSRAYAYLLGLYLGDGWISKGPRAERLRFALDSNYPGIVAECVRALTVLIPGRRASASKRRNSSCVDVGMYFTRWSTLLPQHGPGRKHERAIVLASWQTAIVDANHERFIRGLIHSDGCRVLVPDRGNPSLRYHFSNRSGDIKGLYCRSLDALGISWTRPSSRDIAVYRKDATAKLDAFVGPKY